MHKFFIELAYLCNQAIDAGDVERARKALAAAESNATLPGERHVCHSLANQVQRLICKQYEAQA